MHTCLLIAQSGVGPFFMHFLVGGELYSRLKDSVCSVGREKVALVALDGREAMISLSQS